MDMAHPPAPRLKEIKNEKTNTRDCIQTSFFNLTKLGISYEHGH